MRENHFNPLFTPQIDQKKSPIFVARYTAALPPSVVKCEQYIKPLIEFK
jgi:hypothetical protein